MLVNQMQFQCLYKGGMYMYIVPVLGDGGRGLMRE